MATMTGKQARQFWKSLMDNPSSSEVSCWVRRPTRVLPAGVSDSGGFGAGVEKERDLASHNKAHLNCDCAQA